MHLPGQEHLLYTLTKSVRKTTKWCRLAIIAEYLETYVKDKKLNGKNTI